MRAGLATVEEIGRLLAGTDARLAARIGIATGQVIMSDFTSQETSDKDAVTGRPPNLRGTLQTLAVPGTVVISWRSCSGSLVLRQERRRPSHTPRGRG